ncbi:MAG: VWA domain-containing protein [Pseudomonadota bacterium]
MNFKLLRATMLAFLLTGPAWAQSSCGDGQVLNPDTGGCEDPGNGGGGSDPGTGSGDDGLEPRLLRFLTPDNGDSFAAGTSVAPTGRTSLTNVQSRPLDLTVVIDTSGSMQAPTPLPNTDTPNPNDALTRLDVVKRGVTTLLGDLADTAVVTIIDFNNRAQALTEKFADTNFDGIADLGSGASRQQIINHVAGLQPIGTQTRYDAALNEVLQQFNNGVPGGFTVDSHDRELIFLSDGQPSNLAYFAQLNALPFRGVDPIFVSVPGNSGPGNARLAEAALRTGGSFFDFSGDANGLADAFANASSRLFGVTSLEITNPDGTTYFADTDSFGNFELDPYALTIGDNTFAARVLFEDGTEFTDTLTLVGTTTNTPAVPLPATAWLLLGALAGTGFVARRRTA